MTFAAVDESGRKMIFGGIVTLGFASVNQSAISIYMFLAALIIRLMLQTVSCIVFRLQNNFQIQNSS